MTQYTQLWQKSTQICQHWQVSGHLEYKPNKRTSSLLSASINGTQQRTYRSLRTVFLKKNLQTFYIWRHLTINLCKFDCWEELRTIVLVSVHCLQLSHVIGEVYRLVNIFNFRFILKRFCNEDMFAGTPHSRHWLENQTSGRQWAPVTVHNLFYVMALFLLKSLSGHVLLISK